VAAAEAVPQLIEAALYGETVGVRAAAVSTLGEIGTDPVDVVPALIAVLRDSESRLVVAAAAALARYGEAAESAAPKLMDVLEAAASVGDHDRIAHAVAALRVVSPDAKAGIRAHFANADPEVRRNVLEELIRQERDGQTESR
jgi:HEAT repeat protein